MISAQRSTTTSKSRLYTEMATKGVVKGATVGPLHVAVNPPVGVVPPDRTAKLEKAVRAAIGLRKSFVDDGPHTQYLSAPRATVERFDAVIEELKSGK